MNNGLILRASIPAEEANYLNGTGGTVSYYGGYKVHSFTSAGTFTPTKSGTYEVFMVGPGGGSSTNSGGIGYGGGGGGGQVISTTMALTAGVGYPVVIGTSGVSGTTFNGTLAQSGSNGNGASGGNAGDGGDSGDGYLGGSGVGSGTGGGGGGAGSTSNGEDGWPGTGTSPVSQGGAGTENDWLGTTKTYGAGGGGASSAVPGTALEGQGGSAEAGDGSVGVYSASGDGDDADANSGAGGGGARGGGVPGNGGTGFLMVRYIFQPEDIRYDLDTFEDIPFRLDVSAIQNNQIGSNFGIASQNISLPGSKNNNKFFNAAFNVNSPNARGFKRSVPCQVLQNGVGVFTGNLILNDVITNGSTDTTYDVTIVNETVDFATLINDQYLTDLDFSEYDHAYTAGNITSSFETSSFFNGDIYYPLVDYGIDGTIPNMYNVAFGGQVGKVDNATTPMLVQQFKPAIRVKSIIDKIFDSVNYEYSSSFFNSEEFSTLYLLSTNTDKNGVTVNSPTDAGFQATGTGSLTLQGLPNSFGQLSFHSEVYDPGGSYDETISTFRVANAGQYAFQASLPFTHGPAGQGGICALTLYLKVNGTIVSQQVYNITNTANGTIGFSTAGLSLAVNDLVTLDYYYEGQTIGLSSVDLFIPASRTFQTIYAPIAIAGATVEMGQQLDPNIKSLDFLKGIIEKFNLVLEPKKNERNTLIVEPFDTWADAGVVKDWSDKYDRAEKISVKHPIASQPLRIVFNDSFDNDVLTQYAKNNFNDERPYGSWTYTANSDVPKGERKVGGFFGPLPTKGLPGAPNMITPLLYRQDGADAKPFKFKPRLGYRVDDQGAVGASQGRFFLLDAQTGDNMEISNYSTLSHLQQYPADNCHSIHFDGKWYPFHQAVIDGFTPFGAFNTYWGRYINELYDDEARLLTLNMNFKPTDLPDIQLNDKIFIDNAYYRINKISGFNITNQDTVQVELLKAPLRKSNYSLRRIYGTPYETPRDVGVFNPSDFRPQGDVIVRDRETDEVITDPVILRKFSSVEGYQFISGSVYWKDQFNQNNLNATDGQAIRGSITVDPTVGSILGAADSGSIGQGVDKAVIIGTELTIQSDVQNSYIGGDSVLIGSSSNNISIFSTKNGEIGPGTTDSVMLASSASYVNGTFNTVIGSYGSSIQDGANQSTLIGTRGIVLDNDYHTFDRHTHIGGNKFTYYATGSGETYRNSVGLGQLPDIPTNAGVDKSNKVLLGDAILTGAQYLRVTNRTASAGGSGTMVGDTSSYLTYFTWTGANGTYTWTLPDATENKGRFLRFMTDGTFDNANTIVNIVPSGSQTIDGDPEYPIKKDYNGLGILSTGTEWVVIQLKA